MRSLAYILIIAAGIWLLVLIEQSSKPAYGLQYTEVLCAQHGGQWEPRGCVFSNGVVCEGRCCHLSDEYLTNGLPM